MSNPPTSKRAVSASHSHLPYSQRRSEAIETLITLLEGRTIDHTHRFLHKTSPNRLSEGSAIGAHMGQFTG